MARFTKAEMTRLQNNNVISGQAHQTMLEAESRANAARQMRDLALADSRALLKSKGIHYNPKSQISFDEKGNLLIDGKVSHRG